ncbi:MAG: hypothetical protein ACRDTU_13250 [Micromonosporaceae bacterium]
MSAVPARSYEHFDDPVPPPEPVVVPARPRRRTGRQAPSRVAAPRESPGSANPEPARDRDSAPVPERTPKAEPVRDRARRPEPAVEPPPAPVAAPRAPFVMLVLVLVSAGIIGLLVLNTKINENSFQLQGMRDRQSTLDTREQGLKSALEEKESPGNLAAAAKRLGLVRAENPAFLHLPDGRVLGVPQPGGTGNTGGR